ncbi:MAG: hypothetical protein JWM05_3082 [Acidimicrobiales bacterium]|nr:hypothetical protein [Acidimicrobiales bacterium]
MDFFPLAKGQHGLITLDQVRAFGISERTIGRLIEKGTLERLGPGVLRVAAVPDGWRQSLLAAVLSIPGSLASHQSAAALWELDGFPPGPLEVVTERWHRRPRPKGVTVHESKDLATADFDLRSGIPCTSLVRTLVDLPAVVHEFKAGQALDSAARHDRPLLARVRDRHVEVARRGRNGTVKLRELLLERGAGADLVDSGFERRALRLISNSHLPRPVTQWQVRDPGFVCYLDIAWPDRLVAMECDSVAHHLSVNAFHRDRERRRRLSRLGWTVLEFTYDDVRQRGLMVIRELSHHLRSAA